jgi:hypothetical protein
VLSFHLSWKSAFAPMRVWPGCGIVLVANIRQISLLTMLF